MQIVLLNGGLANQTFQYLFGMYLQARSKEIVVFDDSYFDSKIKAKPHSNNANSQRRLLKSIFNIEALQLSSLFGSDTWDKMIDISFNKKISMAELLNIKGLGLKLIAETDDYIFSGEVIKLSSLEWQTKYFPNEKIYYHGYWINNFAFKSISASNFLKFNPIEESHNIEFSEKLNDQNTVAVHIRRFSLEGFNWDVPIEWYQQSIWALRKKNTKLKFFIFSDDLEWCRLNLFNLGFSISDSVTFIYGNEPENLNHRDLQLMSMAHHHVMSNSSFSYLSVLLNNRNGFIFNPTNRSLK